MPEPSTKTLYCSFCGKSQNEVDQLIAGPAAGLFICDECVELCMSIVLERRTEKRTRVPLAVQSDFERLERNIEDDVNRWIERLQALKRLSKS